MKEHGMTNERARQILLDALENERRYAAKELHDGVAQTALQLGLQARICQKLLERDDLEALAGELSQLEDRINRVSHQVRALIQDLRPPTLETEQPDLEDYIQYAVDLHQQRGGVLTSYRYKIQNRSLPLSADQMLGLMRIVQEALLHVRKSSEAQEVRLTVSSKENAVVMTIVDDGKVSDVARDQNRPDGRDTESYSNLEAKSEAVGGSLTIERNQKGPGTTITVIVPILR
jgi:signal transduction histidine kinase